MESIKEVPEVSKSRQFPSTEMGPPPPYYRAPPLPVNVVGPANVVTTIITGPVVGPKSSPVTCPSCNEVVMTKVKHKPTTRTHLLAVILCLICFPCVCVPYLVDSCNDANHYCPNCSSYIGRHYN